MSNVLIGPTAVVASDCSYIEYGRLMPFVFLGPENKGMAERMFPAINQYLVVAANCIIRPGHTFTPIYRFGDNERLRASLFIPGCVGFHPQPNELWGILPESCAAIQETRNKLKSKELSGKPNLGKALCPLAGYCLAGMCGEEYTTELAQAHLEVVTSQPFLRNPALSEIAPSAKTKQHKRVLRPHFPDAKIPRLPGIPT